MRAFFLYGVILSVALGAGACNADGTVLWYLEPVDSGSSSSGAGGEASTGSATGAGGAIVEPPPPSTGSLITGGSGPEVVICEETGDPNQPPCSCPTGATCMCLPSPVGQTCDMICPEGGCTFECLPDVICDADCQGGCTTLCHGGTFCSQLCFDGGCDMTCLAGASCYLGSFQGPSQMICDLGADCQCFEGDGCFCIGEGCP